MADNEQNQPPEHEAQPELTDRGANPAPPEPADDQPPVDTGEPKRRKKRISSQRKKTDSSTWITAAISAIASLAGASVGAFATYHSAQSQATAQVHAAQSSATAQANEELVKTRQTEYADYISQQIDLMDTEQTLCNRLDSNRTDPNELNPLEDQWKQISFSSDT